MTDVKKLLMNVRNAQIEINSIRYEIIRLDSNATSTAIHYKDIQVQTSQGEGQIDENLPEELDLKAILENKIRSISFDQKKAELMIEKLKQRNYRNVLRCYYINGMSWKDTADSIGYDYFYIYELCRKALAELRRIQGSR